VPLPLVTGAAADPAGGEERSYHELLREAVEADEPTARCGAAGGSEAGGGGDGGGASGGGARAGRAAGSDSLLPAACCLPASCRWEDMDEGGRLLLEELRERQQMVAEGLIDLERSFDDFRVVVGESGL
jgi:hypothetical protein